MEMEINKVSSSYCGVEVKASFDRTPVREHCSCHKGWQLSFHYLMTKGMNDIWKETKSEAQIKRGQKSLDQRKKNEAKL